MAKLSELLSKRIPTILGILFLVGGLGVGIFIVGQGTGGFLPKASPETTPRNIKITNISDNAFTVSFITDVASPGYVKYGTEANSLNNQTSDDRDQLSGSVGQFTTHHITVRSLSPSTAYYFAIGTASREIYTDNGKPYQVTTAPRIGGAPEALTVYGSVVTRASTPASDSIVYISVPGSSPLSTLVKSSGSWAVPLSTARTTNLSSYAALTDDTVIDILVQGKDAASNATAKATVANAQPVPTITLGQNSDFTTGSTSDQTATSSATTDSRFSADQLNPATEASGSTTQSLGITFSNPSQEGEEINTVRPALQGKAPAKTVVTIEVHSDPVYKGTVTTDANGNWSFTPSGDLAPGDHSITVSYQDANGQLITETRTFKVLAQGVSTNPAFTSTPSASPKPTPIATSSGTSTSSAKKTVATGSAVPKSGSTEQTMMLLSLGFSLLLAGGYAWKKAALLSAKDDAYNE